MYLQTPLKNKFVNTECMLGSCGCKHSNLTLRILQTSNRTRWRPFPRAGCKSRACCFPLIWSSTSPHFILRSPRAQPLAMATFGLTICRAVSCKRGEMKPQWVQIVFNASNSYFRFYEMNMRKFIIIT